MSLSVSRILDVVGGNRRNSAYRVLIKLAGEALTVNNFDASFVSYDFQKLGFTLSYDSRIRTFESVDFILQAFEPFSSYAGELPYGILGSDRKEDIVRKLGEPLGTGKGARRLPVPIGKTKDEWSDYIESVRMAPHTIEWCSFNVQSKRLSIWFDEDLDGQIESLKVSRS